LFGIEDFTFSSGDALDVVGVLDDNQVFEAFKSSGNIVDDGSGVPKGWVIKNYTYEDTTLPLHFDGGSTYVGLMPLRQTWEIEPWVTTPSGFSALRGNLITSVNIYNISKPYTGIDEDVYSQGAKCLVVASGQYATGTNSFGSLNLILNGDPTFPLSNVLTLNSGAGSTFSAKALTVNYKRVRLKQYGGNTYNARSNSVYISTGHYQRLNNNVTGPFVHTVFGGDTYVNAVDIVHRKKHWTADSFNTPQVGFRNLAGRFVALETTVNTDLRQTTGNVFNKNYFPDSGTGLDLLDDFAHNATYSRESTAYTYVSKPDPFNELTDFDTRIRASEQKENGELSDSWAVYRVATYIDVEGIYGPINNLIIKDDKMYFFQDRAFGIPSVNERAVLSDTAGNPTSLGVAGLLSRFDYISTEIGCKHQWGMVIGNSHIYFLDALKRKVYRFGEGIESLGELKGLTGYFNNNLIGTGIVNDNPILERGMNCTFDYKFNEALFTFHTSYLNQAGNQSITANWTVSYNELLEVWNSFYGFKPNIYINSTNRILSCINKQDLYLHNEGEYAVFYGNAPEKSKIKFVVNPEPQRTKKYDVMSWVTSVLDETGSNPIERKEDTWDRLRIYNSFQNTDFIDLVPKPAANYTVARNVKREWTTHIARNAVLAGSSNVDVLASANLNRNQLNKPRLYDNYAIVDLEYDNTDNYRLACQSVITYVR
jgi:hypothetical protein